MAILPTEVINNELDKEKLRKTAVQYLPESSSTTTIEVEEPKAYGWFNNPISPKHKKRILKKAKKLNQKLDANRVGKNYVF